MDRIVEPDARDQRARVVRDRQVVDALVLGIVGREHRAVGRARETDGCW
jgi:hypothetical protein